jgi:hypothetical protein
MQIQKNNLTKAGLLERTINDLSSFLVITPSSIACDIGVFTS